jgi:glyoxylase-like metal-dependent hydrolase (beta-lactamase superfamily II)
MHVECLVLGLYETNCYVVRADKKCHEVLIIDTGLDTSGVTEHLRSNKLKPVAVVLTHGHADHIVGSAAIRTNWGNVQVYIHRLDAEMLTDATINLSLMNGSAFVTEPADVVVEEGDTIEQAGLKLEVIHTPGHSPGSICLYAKDENLLFSGDTLFAGGVGRMDFPGGNMEQLLSSIKEKLLVLPQQTVVYPGHGPQTTIGRELKYNPFIG